MKSALLAAAAAATLMSTPAAAYYIDGNDLHRVCSPDGAQNESCMG